MDQRTVRAVLPINEATKACDLGEDTIRKLVRLGKLKLSRRGKVTTDSMRRYLDECGRRRR